MKQWASILGVLPSDLLIAFSNTTYLEGYEEGITVTIASERDGTHSLPDPRFCRIIALSFVVTTICFPPVIAQVSEGGVLDIAEPE